VKDPGFILSKHRGHQTHTDSLAETPPLGSDISVSIEPSGDLTILKLHPETTSAKQHQRYCISEATSALLHQRNNTLSRISETTP
jgi:hypothetical protein